MEVRYSNNSLGLLLNLNQSIAVFRSTVLVTCFQIMVSLAQCLPVVLIPEKPLVSSVWNDVVNHRCFCIFPFLHALHTQGMCSQEQLPGILPRSIISAIIR